MLTHEKQPWYEERLEGLELGTEEITRTSELLRLMIEAVAAVIHLLPMCVPRAHV